MEKDPKIYACSNAEKKTKAALMAKSFINALDQDMYPF
jgi:hypothetical protein